LKHKDQIHRDEDPEFLDELSDILDIRNWDLVSFDPEDIENVDDKTDKLFNENVEKMLKKFDACSKFYEDMDSDPLKEELIRTLHILYESEKDRKKLSRAAMKYHIIDQWMYLLALSKLILYSMFEGI